MRRSSARLFTAQKQLSISSQASSSGSLPRESVLVNQAVSVACKSRGQLGLNVQVAVRGHVERHLCDLRAREREALCIAPANRVTTVVADAQTFAAQRVLQRHH